MEHAIAENIYAGNAMVRRAFFQYGLLLPRSPFAHVDQSIGKNTAAGNTGLIEPTRYIAKDFEEMTIDGVKMGLAVFDASARPRFLHRMEQIAESATMMELN